MFNNTNNTRSKTSGEVCIFDSRKTSILYRYMYELCVNGKVHRFMHSIWII